MSTPSTSPPAAADAASIRHIRALFQRKMIERATALADARWPGSGEMVKLAAEWAELSPADRRARLSQIGPEDLARMRGLADLNPDLARVLDDLEARGVLPPALYTAQPGEERQEALVDAALDLGEQTARDAIEKATSPEAAAAVAGAAAAVAGKPLLTPLPQVEMPDLDLGLPSTDEFLEDEAERRIAAAEAAQAVLDRVRQRVDERVSKVLSIGDEKPVPVAEPVTVVQEPLPEPELPRVDAVVTPLVAPTSASEALAARIRETPVIVFDEFAPAPGAAELSAAARSLGLPLREFTLEAGESRSVFGGLRRRGPEVTIVPGPLPRALATANLVVVRGSVYPKMVARWREGFCDIPGTKASTRIAPECRIVVFDD